MIAVISSVGVWQLERRGEWALARAMGHAVAATFVLLVLMEPRVAAPHPPLQDYRIDQYIWHNRTETFRSMLKLILCVKYLFLIYLFMLVISI